MTAVLYALPALLLGAALVLAAEHAYRHRARLVAAYRGLVRRLTIAIRVDEHGNGRHARLVSRPHLIPVSHGTHRKPLGRHENALEVKAA